MQSSIRLSFIKSALEQYNGQFASLIKGRYLDPLENWTDDNHLNKFIGLVEASVDLEQLENGEYMISSGYDSQLLALKNEQESLEHQIHDLHIKAANDLDLALDKALKLEKGTQHGYAFRITKKEEPKVRKKLNTQFILIETRKDGVFEGVAWSLSELDVLLSFADVAASSPTPYTRPIITPSVGINQLLKFPLQEKGTCFFMIMRISGCGRYYFGRESASLC
ncbi:UNVERIFIED_CONTAM: DNA mismatch repair protein MSH2 [Sesamum radiatum]|uniref:DNA mismatch repair protein MSH2 n=1 Tax=Sesamum radiatum TaxID=300843 RepID=A0AAW2WKQ2_SESRA